MTKYEIARRALGSVVDAAADEPNFSEEEAVEALIVVAIEAFAKTAGRKRAADCVAYELANLGGDVDTVFLRSR